MSIQSIGRYEIVAPLATGGMGEVVLARERGPAGFERLVVVKRIRPQVAAEPEMVESFLREARLVARLSHPNIVQIIELGQLDDEEYFIAMEYIEGSSVAELQVLSDLLNRPIPLEVIVSIGIQACRGLEAAHDLRAADGSPVGLIHRDVTPQNLMCTTRGFVKLLDFGIAKTTVGPETTWSGTPKGKPAYFSPEQARNQPLDRRTDIFSLGVVLWELASGRSLFERGGTFGTLRAIVEDPVPLLQEFRVDPRFADIVHTALSRDRDQRYADASLFRARLSEYAATKNWDDVHDSLSEFVSDVAGSIVEGRRDTTGRAKDRALTEAEGKSLVHVTSREELAATAPTLEVAPTLLDALEEVAGAASTDETSTAERAPSDTEASEDSEREEDPTAEVAEVHESGAVSTSPPDPAAPLKAYLRDMAILSVGFVAMGVVSASVWLKPTWIPPVAFCAIVLLPVLGWRAFGGPESDPGSRTAQLLRVAAPGALFAIVLATWMAAPARAALAEGAAAFGWGDTASRALFDPNPAVARAVCEGLARSDLQLPQDAVAQKLSSTQPDSAACLIEQLDPQAESTTVVLDYLLPRWSEELRVATDEGDQDRLCEKANWVAQAIKRSGRVADTSLLNCALRAKSAPARQCCTQAYRLLAMGQQGVAMSLPPADSAVDNGGTLVAEFLTALWNDETTIDPQMRQSLELDSGAMHAWVLAVHCENLQRSSTFAEAAAPLRHLQSLVGGECVLPEEMDQEQAVWASTCGWFFDEHRFWEATGDEGRMLCRAVADGVGAVTFRAATSAVERAFEEALEEDEQGRTQAERERRQRQCLEEGEAEVCVRLGLAYQRDDQFGTAFEYYRAGCEAGDGEACNSAGYVLSIELPPNEPNKKEALEFYERACSLGDSTGCANQADELKRGRYTRRNLKRARQIYAAQCDDGEGYACGGLAIMYWDGLGIEQDRPRAIELWKRACNRYSRYCVDLALDARSLPQRPSVPKEIILIRKGCTVLSKKLCLRDIALRYLSGRGVPQDERRARRHFAWACELGDEKSCGRK